MVKLYRWVSSREVMIMVQTGLGRVLDKAAWFARPSRTALSPCYPNARRGSGSRTVAARHADPRVSHKLITKRYKRLCSRSYPPFDVTLQYLFWRFASPNTACQELE